MFVLLSVYLSNFREGYETAKALKELVELQTELVWKDDLDFDFVRREVATILDPSPRQALLCDNLVSKNQLKSTNDDLAGFTL